METNALTTETTTTHSCGLDTETDCMICGEPRKSIGEVSLKCGHKICLTCFMGLLFVGNGFSNNKKCPYCRDPIDCGKFKNTIRQVNYHQDAENRRLAVREEEIRLRAERQRAYQIRETQRRLIYNSPEQVAIRATQREAERVARATRLEVRRVANLALTANYQNFATNQPIATIITRTWKPRRNSCAYRILQILSQHNGAMPIADILQLLSTQDRRFTQNTRRTNILRLEREGYTTNTTGASRLITHITLN